MNQDASKWTLIHFDWHRALAVDLTWNTWARVAEQKTLNLSSNIRYSEESHAIQAAIAGLGVALLSLILVEEELRLGLLQIVCEPTLKAMSYHVLKSNQQATSEAAAKVENWLLQMANQNTSEYPK